MVGNVAVQGPDAAIAGLDQDVLRLARRNLDRVELPWFLEIDPILGDVEEVLSVKVHGVGVDRDVGEANAEPLAQPQPEWFVRRVCRKD